MYGKPFLQNFEFPDLALFKTRVLTSGREIPAFGTIHFPRQEQIALGQNANICFANLASEGKNPAFQAV